MARSAAPARGRALVLALVVCALALVALVAILSRRGDGARAPAPDAAAQRAEDVAATGAVEVDEAAPAPVEAPRAEVETPAPAAPADADGPFLVGRVLDGRGRPLEDAAPRVAVEGPLGQLLAAPVDAEGGFGPLRLLPGRWRVVAQAEGHRAAAREVTLVAGASPEPLELVLPRVTTLTVVVVATRGTLAGLASLLTAELAVEGAQDVERRSLAGLGALEGEERSWRAGFEPLADRGASLELRLGAERLVRRDVAAGQELVRVELDPRALRERLVELEVELRDRDGEPLQGLGQVLLRWGADAHLVAGQPGEEPWRVRFAACPPGLARLVAVDVDGRLAEAELFVPHVGPARVELALELRAPGQDR